ncbi:DUF2238 domain-containing protein [Bacillus sp. 1NLA3E]|uniref:DUF2238 domain-containing protein n=1 Tax=Bacillus sp. 1NLA3E TaxID=666686 RepID=UPI000247E9AA|nr:DUF2238 domain-containing protein [Bacillus sp. 1NLA3E]AGK53340.1 hypothetical protein B1NLA3E_07890 [Bacillus sp. 1NLA3E]
MAKKKSNYIHLLILVIVIAVFIWSFIKPVQYSDWILEVSPALIGLMMAIVIYNKFRLTTLSYIIIALLSILVFVGGHYTYSKVPLFDWIKDHFNLRRNHYDRFGHFFKGLITILLREILLKKSPLVKGKWLFVITVSMSLAIAAFYEINEWIFSKLAHGGKTAKNFLGTQGDIWDAQWDMAFTLGGSILAYLFLANLHNRLLKQQKENNHLK